MADEHLPQPTQQHLLSTESDEESDNEFFTNGIVELKGYLCKWTNYIHGWQPRYIVLKDGTLSYYKSEEDSDLGCRGAISLHKATIKVNIIIFSYKNDFHFVASNN
jgi:collagen type IV alpha-3-binding protein